MLHFSALAPVLERSDEFRPGVKLVEGNADHKPSDLTFVKTALLPRRSAPKPILTPARFIISRVNSVESPKRFSFSMLALGG